MNKRKARALFRIFSERSECECLSLWRHILRFGIIQEELYEYVYSDLIHFTISVECNVITDHHVAVNEYKCVFDMVSVVFAFVFCLWAWGLWDRVFNYMQRQLIS